MEQRLIEKFAAQFKPVDKRVKDEDILLFLDKRTTDRFDRETYLELKSRIEDRGLDLTPLNFAKVFQEAHDLLELKHKRNTEELNSIDKMGKLLKASKGTVFKVEIFNLNLENYTDSANCLQFQIAKDFIANVYNFTSESITELYVPENELQSLGNITLFSSLGKLLDRKSTELGHSTSRPQRLQFNDNSLLSFEVEVSPASTGEAISALGRRKAELQNIQIFIMNKRNMLKGTFKDVFESSNGFKAISNAKCSKLLLVSVILTSVMFGISLYLNFTRCMFIDIFIATSFFGNTYIWRNFNIFLGIKLILVLVASICMDIGWEVTKLLHYTHKYEDTLKSVRIQGLVLNAINVLIKGALVYLYYQLATENQKGGFLELDEEVSINEVNEDEYLMRLPNYEDQVLQ
jgi:hypothetical protein